VKVQPELDALPGPHHPVEEAVLAAREEEIEHHRDDGQLKKEDILETVHHQFELEDDEVTDEHRLARLHSIVLFS